jgi:hypothetical protein
MSFHFVIRSSRKGLAAIMKKPILLAAAFRGNIPMRGCLIHPLSSLLEAEGINDVHFARQGGPHEQKPFT